MEKNLAAVQGEVAGLDERKAALLAQLAQVDALLAQAHARKVLKPCLSWLSYCPAAAQQSAVDGRKYTAI